MSSHALRIWDEDAIYLVTNRCFQSQCLLRPDDTLNPLAVAWLRRTVRIFELELFAAVVLGDRFVLIVRAPKKNLSKAMGYFQGNLARALNAARGRKDTVFPRRFEAEPILDDDALLEQVRELLMLPVVHGEVGEPGEWPGYTSWHPMTAGASPWLGDEGSLPPLTKLPFWSELDDVAYPRRVEALVAEADAADSEWPALPALGPRQVRERDWRQRSAGPRARRRATCHASKPRLAHRYERRRKTIRSDYDLAMEAWRGGEAAVFPEGTFPPGWSRVSTADDAARPPDDVAVAA